MLHNNRINAGIGLLIALFTVAISIFISCNKWVDPKPVNDPRLTNPYCNDPAAVNYNWGFPGKPDNTICFYPTDDFKGRYVYYDSIYSESGSTAGNFLYAQTDTLNIYALSHTKLIIIGFCGTDTLKMTAVTFTASVDTVVGDTLTATQGQLLCSSNDTVNGTIFYSRIDSQLHVNLQVVSDTWQYSHIGKAKAF